MLSSTALPRALIKRHGAHALGSQRLPQMTSLRATSNSGQHMLVDAPASNHGARVRFVVYKKGLGDKIQSVPASHFGGLKSPEFLKLNPQGKFPVMILPDGTSLPESEVIVQYLLDKFKGVGPGLVASTPEAQAIGTLVTRIHDQYISPIQACLYRALPSAEQRAKDVATLAMQLDAIEGSMVGGPFLTGPDITTADGALFPTVVFMQYILPKYFGWSDVFAGRPKLRAWWEAVQADPEASKIIDEIWGGLQEWDKADRWNKLGITEQVASNPKVFQLA